MAGTLEELWLSYNQITSLDGLAGLQQLTTLYISNNLVKSWNELDKLVRFVLILRMLCFCFFSFKAYFMTEDPLLYCFFSSSFCSLVSTFFIPFFPPFLPSFLSSFLPSYLPTFLPSFLSSVFSSLRLSVSWCVS